MMTTRFIGIGLVVVATVAVVAVVAPVTAAQKPVSSGEVVTRTFTIEAIDQANRLVTLKGTDGYLQEVYCGPEVQRFDALKVGDTVTFRYHESVVSALRRPGQAPGRRCRGSGFCRRTSRSPR